MKPTLDKTHPELAQQINEDSPLRADEVTAGSGKSPLWYCAKGHRWSATVASRARSQRGCPYCSGLKPIPGENDLATLRPDLVPYWRDERAMNSVSAGSNYKARWACELGHIYTDSVQNRAQGKQCRVCSHRVILAGFNDLASTFPDIARQWHQPKNGETTPSAVSFRSGTPYYWMCDKNPSHIWKTSVRNRTALGSGCPYCSGLKVSPQENSLLAQFPDIAAELSAQNNVSAERISPGSHKEYLWECPHGHLWNAPVRSRTKHGRQCTVCSGRVIVEGTNDLSTTHPDFIDEWDDPRPITEFSQGSHHRAQWKCRQWGHTWTAEIYNRVRGNGCPECASAKTVSAAEGEIGEYISSLGFSVVKDRKVLGGKELDIYVPEKQLAVEYNSLYYHSEDMGRDKWYHHEKFSQCRAQGIQLIQIWEDDYTRNPGLIRRMLAHKLGVGAVSSEGTAHARNTVFGAVNRPDAAEFLLTHHIQGSHQTSSSYGLRSKGGQQLLAVMSVALKKKGTVLEISRFATSAPVSGGFSKLLTNILRLEKYHTVEKVISYSHNDHSWGEVYEKNGFTKVHDGTPGYFYIANGKREHRLNYSPKRFREREDLIFEEGLSERELAALNGLSRIWDSGSALWERTV